MATNFYSGLATGLNQADERMRADERLRMERERQQAIETQQAISNQRADERFAMEKQDSARRAALSDFQFGEVKRKADEEKLFREEFKQFNTDFWGPRKIKDAEGNEVDFTPDRNDPKLNAQYYAGMTQLYDKHQRLTPVERKALLETQKWMKDTGTRDALQGLALTGTVTETQKAELAPLFNIDPKAPLSMDVDTSGPYKRMVIVGTTIDGKPFRQDASGVFAALGLPDMDPNKPARQFALDKANIERIEEMAETQRALAARYREDAALSGRTPSRGGSTKPVDPQKRVKGFTDFVTGPKAKVQLGYSGTFGTGLKKDAIDPDKQSFVMRQGESFIKDNPDLSDSEAFQRSVELYEAMEKKALGGTKWVRDKNNPDGYRPATTADKDAVPFSAIASNAPGKAAIRSRLVGELQKQLDAEYAAAKNK